MQRRRLVNTLIRARNRWRLFWRRDLPAAAARIRAASPGRDERGQLLRLAAATLALLGIVHAVDQLAGRPWATIALCVPLLLAAIAGELLAGRRPPEN